MIPLIDADILRYEIGYASEVGWRAIKEDPEAIPPFDYVARMLGERLDFISKAVEATEKSELFLTEGKGFRDSVATMKPYKGTRKGVKPWHYNNLSAYMKGVLEATVVTNLEADDMLAIRHTANPENTIICTRDKDLRQVPGKLYSWELGLQPSFGPAQVEPFGTLDLIRKKGKTPKLVGTGFLWFCAQMLTGDTVDNIPGCKGIGPTKAYDLLQDAVDEENCLDIVRDAYDEVYLDNPDEVFLEMGQLLWMIRRYNEDGSPEMWYPGLKQ